MKNKKLTTQDLSAFRKKNKSKKIGLVHGVFDLFHYGHILHLEKAKSLCDILVVSLTDDKFISKGPGRPFYNNNQRKKLIASMSQVDYVVLSENKSAVEIIDALKPNLYFKGSDYKDFNKDYSKKILEETDAVKRNKGAFFLTNEKTFSSTKLINNYSDNFDPNVKKFLLKSSKEFSFDKIFNIFKKVEKLKILIIGEIIIDKYTFTTPLGKSPKEQLVPVKIKKSETYGGGVIATANHISNFVKDETLGFYRIIHYYNLWYKNRSIPQNFLLVKYEDLLENGVQELQKINNYLSLNVSVSDIEKVYEESSANKMKKKEIANQLEGFEDFGKKKNQLKVRNAKIGDYVKELSEEDIAYCNEKMKDLNPYFNY